MKWMRMMMMMMTSVVAFMQQESSMLPAAKSGLAALTGFNVAVTISDKGTRLGEVTREGAWRLIADAYGKCEQRLWLH